jgi:hypothetical protein
VKEARRSRRQDQAASDSSSQFSSGGEVEDLLGEGGLAPGAVVLLVVLGEEVRQRDDVAVEDQERVVGRSRLPVTTSGSSTPGFQSAASTAGLSRLRRSSAT